MKSDSETIFSSANFSLLVNVDQNSKPLNISNETGDDFECDFSCMTKYWVLEGYLVVILIATLVANGAAMVKLYQQYKDKASTSGHDSYLACFVGFNLSFINFTVGLLG